MNCSFVIVDVRRFDQPIVYSSPSFCALTGYPDAEVIGKNCRFLQAPLGDVRKGERRTHTSNEAVALLKKNLVANKECQTSVLNYRKDGTSFINLVTVVPLPGGVSGAAREEDDDYVYHIGFQVDLNQPNPVLDQVHHTFNPSSAKIDFPAESHIEEQSQHPSTGRERKTNALPPVVMSKELKRLIADPGFVKSIPLSMSTVTSSSPSSHDGPSGNANHILHLLLLEAAPDFIHVVSLKGDFLYVAPSVRRVLGYEPDEMVGKAISDYAHPEDVIPLKRELKESSATGCSASNNTDSSLATGQSVNGGVPRSVNLLFRAQTKTGKFVWMECRGRLHVEPGKGRKAIILSGRARGMMGLSIEDVKGAGGLARGVRFPGISGAEVKEPAKEDNWRMDEQEVWGMIAGHGKETMTFVSIGRGVVDVLGWSPDELIGRSVTDVVLDDGMKHALGGIVANMRAYQQVRSSHHHSVAGVDSARVKKARCLLRRKDGDVADVWFIIYRAESNEDVEEEPYENGVPNDDRRGCSSTTPTLLVFQIRRVDAETLIPGSRSDPVTTVFPAPILHSTPIHALDSTSSSLAGAIPIPRVISFSLSTTSPSSSKSSVSVDMFEDLAISRGSSWQYELQQLRFANVRLREELLAFESTNVVESSGVGGDAMKTVPQGPESALVSLTAPTAQPQVQVRAGIPVPAGLGFSQSPSVLGCSSVPHAIDDEFSFTPTALYGHEYHHQSTTMLPHPSVYSVDMSQQQPPASISHTIHSLPLMSSQTPCHHWSRTVPPVYTSTPIYNHTKMSLKRPWDPAD